MTTDPRDKVLVSTNQSLFCTGCGMPLTNVPSDQTRIMCVSLKCKNRCVELRRPDLNDATSL